jgi:hypothetical protein
MRRRLAPFFQEHSAGNVPEPNIPYGAFSAEHAAMLSLEKLAVVSFYLGLLGDHSSGGASARDRRR